MILLLLSIFCFTAGLCEEIPSDVKKDVLSIMYISPVALKNCFKFKINNENVRFLLYSNEDEKEGTILSINNTEKMSLKNRLIILIHGWLQNGQNKFIMNMKYLYLKMFSANVIVVDWSSYATINYAASYCAVSQVGLLLGELICNIAQTGSVKLEDIQLNGFSLGAHVSGFAGQYVKSKTNGLKIGRINGLDAAGPGFLGLPTDKRLDRSDALFVQGIHTNNLKAGYTDSYGTVDFHVNYQTILSCGSIQEGCPTFSGIPLDGIITSQNVFQYVLCSHIRAFLYFIESMSSTSFIGISCNSCRQFVAGQCKSPEYVTMGEYTPPTTFGTFYLATNEHSPFAKGLKGTKPAL